METHNEQLESTDINASEIKEFIPQPQTNNEKVNSRQNNPLEDKAEKTTLWKYSPVSDSQPEPHSDYYFKTCNTHPFGYRLFGARVRGKTHKHDGSNCDDWFDFGTSGRWTIITVSDGAGSKLFSRIGARVASETAVAYLKNRLKDINAEKYINKLSREELDNCIKQKKDIFEVITQSIFMAFIEAFSELKRTFGEKQNNQHYLDCLGGKEMNFTDFSTTLLVALHTKVHYKDDDYDIVFSCNIGDGAIAAIDHENNVVLLTAPDSGEFSGETDFLINEKKIEPSNLVSKTNIYFSKIRTIMVMSDGVSDDYYPNNTDFKYLYANLILNRIIRLRLKENEIIGVLETTILKTKDNIFNLDLADLKDIRMSSDNPHQEITYRSVDSYSKALGVPVDLLTGSPQLLMSTIYSKNVPLTEENDESKKLMLWLDTYYVKGSFDDRTLVLLHNERQ